MLRYVAILGLLLLARPTLAQAHDDSTLAAARQLGQEGVTLYEQGDPAGAVGKLERAYAVVKVPTLGLWLGRALEKLGKLVEASQRYHEVMLVALKPGDPKVFARAQADAQNAYEALLLRVPRLTIELDGATASDVNVTIDSNPLPSALVGAAVPLNPGPRKVEGRRDRAVVTEDVVLAEGERRVVKLAFPAPTPAEVAAASETPAQANTEAAQHDAGLTQPGPAQDATAGTPATKQWWFWGGLAAVVLGGTAVALAVALGSRSGGQQPLYQGSAGSVPGP